MNQTLPSEVSRRSEELAEKRREGILTTEEHEELVRIGDEFERLAGLRLEAMVELARLRQVPLSSLLPAAKVRPTDPPLPPVE